MTTAALCQEAATQELSPEPRLHLNFLDGLRGLAALFVVMSHLWLTSCSFSNGSTFPAWFRVTYFLKYGHLAVDVFIILSGFCLMLPIARSDDGQMPHGICNFFLRRARRILPPYYAALLLSLAMIALIPALRQNEHTIHSLYDSQDWGGAIISHLLLIHNWNAEWVYRINGALWSVATEWQIYFLFPLLLLPLWRRFGLLVTTVISYVLGLLTIRLGLGYACFWYVGLFAMGMAGAVLAFSPTIRTYFKPTRRGIILIFILAVCVVTNAKIAHPWFGVTDLYVGTATCFFLIYCTRTLRSAERAP